MPHCTKTNTLEYHTVAGSCETKSICKKGELRLGVFFDGTGNDDEFNEEFSNVKKLFDVYPKQQYDKKNYKGNTSAYVRGVGSRKDTFKQDPSQKDRKKYDPNKEYKEDFLTGGAMGTGGFARINHMVYELQKAIEEFKEKIKFYPKTIALDVFGFSRGAIQARHYVNVIKQGFYKLNGPYSDYKPNDFTIKSLNVFDSVSSFGTVFIPGQPQDPGWMYNIKEGWVLNTLHFMADDEFRIHFDGQTVYGSQDLDYPKDVESTTFKELVFLGAHSDIGGGYRMRHHGRSNNHLAKIYLNKMYDMATANGVPFLPAPEGSTAWKISEELNTKYDAIQNKYKTYPKLKIAHKKFRERMGYLNKPLSPKAANYLSPKELKQIVTQNKKEIAYIEKTIPYLEKKLAKASGSHKKYLFNSITITSGNKTQYSDKLRKATSRIKTLKRENANYTKQTTAYSELKKVFKGDTSDDYQQFLKVSIEFHNTYVHKSHSAPLQKDYDGDGKKTGSKRETMGMLAETDGIIHRSLHRHCYYQKHDDVIKNLCKHENAKKTRLIKVIPGFYDLANFTFYKWALPEPLKD